MSEASQRDTQAPFLRIPWIARGFQHPGAVVRVAHSRQPKASTEDSFFAEILKTDRTIQSCLSYHIEEESPTGSARGQNAEGLEGQQDNDECLKEVTTIIAMGEGMNGHPKILHGGMTAALIDESIGIYQATNYAYQVRRRAARSKKKGEKDVFTGTFTAELKVRYLAPIRTPGCIEVKVKRTKKEGRKEWLRAEVRQWVGEGEEEDREGEGGGKVIVVAEGEALFITPRAGPRPGVQSGAKL
jgi:acyl-coenzyme A thioesterase PaaI-like protein